jgi:hypothetical protein
LYLAVALYGGGWEGLWQRSTDAIAMCQILEQLNGPPPAAIAVDVAIAVSPHGMALAYAKVAAQILADPARSGEIVSLFDRAIGRLGRLFGVGFDTPEGAMWQCVTYAILVVGYETGYSADMKDNGMLHYVGQHDGKIGYPILRSSDPRLVLFAVLDSAHAAGASWSTLATILRKHAAPPSLEQIVAATMPGSV